MDSSSIDVLQEVAPPIEAINYLALGDSYTIGQSVPSELNYPNQLTARLSADGIHIDSLKIIARTGWTTGNLQNAINQEQLRPTYDMVSLLIGVNNQFRGQSSEEYAKEFEALLQQAIQFAGGEKDKVFVLSIPDYAYTPFGQRFDSKQISEEIDLFNDINKRITTEYQVLYFDITPISRQGNEQPELVTTDGLHPSGEQYLRWVDTIYEDIKMFVLMIK